MFKRLLFIGYDFSKHMKKMNISAFAASTAFFLFLSLIPALMLLCACIPYTPLTEANLMSAVTEISPDTMDALLVSIIVDVYDKSIGIVSITAIVTLWSAGKGVLALMRGLNAINDVVENRNYFLLRLVASFYTILILLAVLLSLLAMVFGNVLISVVEGTIPQLAYLLALLMHFRTPTIWLVLTIVIALMYAYIPERRQRVKTQLPGAAVDCELAACAVIDHKAGVAHRQRGAGVTGLEGPDSGAVGGIDRHIPGIQLHKAAGQLLHLQGGADAGAGRVPAACAVERQNDGIRQIPQHGDGGAEQPAGHRQNRRPAARRTGQDE